jgi:hypothetical protein
MNKRSIRFSNVVGIVLIIDLGVNNRVTCATPGIGNLMSEQMRTARARKMGVDSKSHVG